MRARFLKPVREPVVGMLIRNRLGIDVFGTNTRLQQKGLGSFEAGEELEVSFRFDCLLTQQEYTLTVATQHWDGSSQDWLDDVVSFRVVDSSEIGGSCESRDGNRMAEEVGTVVSTAGREFFGHPRGLATLFMTEMWERFSYYGMRALLVLFMTALGGLRRPGLRCRQGRRIYGLYTAMVYMLSLPGGWIADRFLGQRRGRAVRRGC